MTSSPKPTPRHLTLRRGLVLLLALVTWGSTVEFHHNHGLTELAFWGKASGGCHPELATHLEPTPPDKPRECWGCLSRLRPRDGLVEAQSPSSVPLIALYVCSVPVDLPATTALSSRVSRGPPLAFA